MQTMAFRPQMEHDGVEGGSGDEEFTSRRFFRPSITSDGDDEMGEALHLTEEEIAKEEAKKRKYARFDSCKP